MSQTVTVYYAKVSAAGEVLEQWRSKTERRGVTSDVWYVGGPVPPPTDVTAGSVLSPGVAVEAAKAYAAERRKPNMAYLSTAPVVVTVKLDRPEQAR